MAKFCGNCGAKLDNDAKVCGQCGTPLDRTSVNISGLKASDPEKQKKVKKVVKLAVVLATLIVTAVVVLKIALRYTGYNGLLRKVMTAYENYDIDTLVSLSSDMYYYGEEDWVESYFEYAVGNNLDFFEVSVGHSYNLSYEIEETYVMSERKANEILNEIENAYADFDISVIDKIVAADLIFTAKQGSKSVSKNLQVIMTKEGNAWKLLYLK